MKEYILNFFTEIGGLIVYIGRIVAALVRGPLEWRETLIQMYRVGVQSLLVVFMAGFFVGGIMVIQFNFPLEMLGAQVYLGGVTTSVILREVGPVLIAAMISGRIGAFIAAELGTMKVTEQVEAVRCLGVDPMTYLVAPRFIAVVVMVVLLTVVGLIIASVGGALVAYALLDINLYYYYVYVVKLTDTTAFSYSLIKGFVFGIMMATISCRKGMMAEGGAIGVGRGVRSSLVATAIAIFISDYFLSSILRVITRFADMGRLLYL